jgi:SAM-dependent methyltransferase
MENSNTLEVLGRLISNPRQFARAWRITQQELIRRRVLGVISDGHLDTVTPSLMTGWAVSPEGEPPMLALAIAGKKVMEFRPSLPRDDLHGHFATSALGFAIPINVDPDAEVAVTDLNGRHLGGSPRKPGLMVRLSPLGTRFQYAREYLRRAEVAATGPQALNECLSILRGLPLDDFGEIMISMPSAEMPRISKVLPAMASVEVQRHWTGADDLVLLAQTNMFVRIVAQNFQELCGRRLGDSRILDFGCGYGRILRAMYYFADPDKVFGCDPSDHSIELCRQARIPSPIAMSDNLPTTLPFNGKFDLIYAFSVFTHLSERATNAALGTLQKQLSDDGLLVITIRPVEYWSFDKNVSEVEAEQFVSLHNRAGVAFKPYIDRADVTFGDTSLSLEYIQRSFPALRVAKIERTQLDPYQLLVFVKFKN